jgi:hypothetical protein
MPTSLLLRILAGAVPLPGAGAVGVELAAGVALEPLSRPPPVAGAVGRVAGGLPCRWRAENEMSGTLEEAWEVPRVGTTPTITMSATAAAVAIPSRRPADVGSAGGARTAQRSVPGTPRSAPCHVGGISRYRRSAGPPARSSREAGRSFMGRKAASAASSP